MKYIFNITLLLSVLLGFSACATQRKATQSATSTASKTFDVAAEKLRFLQRVNDNRLYQKNLVASLTATIVTDGKDISVPGSLHMRKDEVIRLQLFLPFLGTEVGRIEFTPTEVLVIDRIHKEYIQADYTQLRFLRDNNLTFYSLQALFWNQLLIPGKQQVGETDLSQFNVELSETGQQEITISAGAIAYCWEADKSTAHISRLQASYQGQTSGRTTLDWQYSQFRPFGSKQYPTRQVATFTTAATNKTHTGSITLELDTPQADANWESRSAVSGKYKRVETEDILGKIMNF